MNTISKKTFLVMMAAAVVFSLAIYILTNKGQQSDAHDSSLDIGNSINKSDEKYAHESSSQNGIRSVTVQAEPESGEEVVIIYDTIEDVEEEGAEPFSHDDVGLIYEGFFAEFDSLTGEDAMTDEQREEFFLRLGATLHVSEVAAQNMASYLRDLDGTLTVKRGVLVEALYYSPVGMDILENEAKTILSTGQTSDYIEAFQTMANLAESVDDVVLESAFDVLSSPESQDAAISALNYIGVAANLPSVYSNDEMGARLIAVANTIEDPISQATAYQKIYQFTAPEESAAIAIEQLSRDANPYLVEETMYSIYDGQIKLTEELKESLEAALASESLTDAQLEMAEHLFGSAAGY